MHVCILVLMACLFIAEQVTARAHSIMSGSLPSTSYNASWNPIPRRPKRLSKSSIAGLKYQKKEKQKCETELFQRKLVVFCYMGPNAPSKFTRKEHLILMRGMLPEIPLDASEVGVREDIVAVMRTNCEYDLSECDKFDFDFINICGKNASLPNLKPGMTFNCKTVKKLAGSGALYVRMTKDFEVLADSGGSLKNIPEHHSPEVGSPAESNELPSYLEYITSSEMATSVPQPPLVPPFVTQASAQSQPPVTPKPQPHVTPMPMPQTPRSVTPMSMPISVTPMPQPPVTPMPQPPVTPMPQPPVTPMPMPQPPMSVTPVPMPNTPMPQPPVIPTPETPMPQTQPSVAPLFTPSLLLPDCIASLAEMFPNSTSQQLRTLVEVTGHDLNRVVDILQSPLSSTRLQKLLHKIRIKKTASESPRLRIDEDEDEDDWVFSAIAFYKSSRVIKDGQLRVAIHGQPGIDTGKYCIHVYYYYSPTV